MLGKPKCHRLYHWSQDPSMPQHLPSSCFSTTMLWQPGSFQTEPPHTHEPRNSSYPCRKHLQRVVLPRHVRMASPYSISWRIRILRNGKRSFSERFESLAKQHLSFVFSPNSKKMPSCLRCKKAIPIFSESVFQWQKRKYHSICDSELFLKKEFVIREIVRCLILLGRKTALKIQFNIIFY